MQATSAPVLTVTLPIELTNGNDGRGSKWFKSSKIRNRVEALLRDLGHVRQPFEFQVDVHVTRVLGPNQRLWDSSSIGRGNYKEIEDALVVIGWFVDDGPKHIRRTTFAQDSDNRPCGPSIVIEIYRTE